MAEISRVWGGTTPGDAGPYTLDHWGDIWDSLFNRNVANGGVLRGLNGELAVSGTISPVTVQAGHAMVNGTWYRNDAAMTVAVPTPGASTRIDLIVLRKSWAAQTVRVTRVAGVEGGGAPALTQSDGVTWDIPLAQVSITTGGVITVTDTRISATFAMPFGAKPADGRLTLTSGTPVTTADVTGATTIYYTPYVGTTLALYDGSALWSNLTFAETAIPLGTLTSGLPYDVFAYNNAGVVAFEILAWTNGTTRATALVRQDGVLVKTGATTRRYLGTFYTTSTTTTEDSLLKRFVFNYYNRRPRKMKVGDATASWTYTTASWRAMNASNNNRIQFLVGVNEEPVVARGIVECNLVANTACGVSVCLDNTNADNSDMFFRGLAGLNTSTPGIACVFEYNSTIVEGFHFLQLVEFGATTMTVWGTASGSELVGAINA